MPLFFFFVFFFLKNSLTVILLCTFLCEGVRIIEVALSSNLYFIFMYSTLKGGESAVINQTNIQPDSKAALWKPLRDRVEGA